MHPLRLLALLSLALLIAGCAQNPQDLRLSVEPPEPVASVDLIASLEYDQVNSSIENYAYHNLRAQILFSRRFRF